MYDTAAGRLVTAVKLVKQEGLTTGHSPSVDD